MRIFISWSGEQAKQVAEVLRDWLPAVVAGAVDTFVSSQDIAKGDRGLNVIASELEAAKYGVVVLTKANVNMPWVNFEAGAIGKSMSEGQVSTLLVDVTRADIKGPLSQFQDTVLASKSDVRQLVRDIAQASGSKAPVHSIDLLFDGLWPDLEAALAQASGGVEPTTEREAKDILEEVLNVVRNIHRDGSRGYGEVMPGGFQYDSPTAGLVAKSQGELAIDRFFASLAVVNDPRVDALARRRRLDIAKDQLLLVDTGVASRLIPYYNLASKGVPHFKVADDRISSRNLSRRMGPVGVRRRVGSRRLWVG